MQRVIRGPSGAQPLLFAVPPGVAGTVSVVEPGNLFRIQFNPAGRGMQRVCLRVGTEFLQCKNAIRGLVIYRYMPAIPEFIKFRQCNVDAGRRFPG